MIINYKTLFDKSIEAMLIMDGNKIIECNQASIKILGFSNRNECLASHPFHLSSKEQSDTPISFDKTNKAFDTAIKNGSFKFDWIHKSPLGEEFPLSISLTSFPVDNSNYIFVLIKEASSEKKEKLELHDTNKSLKETELYAKALKLSTNAILITDSQNNIITVNSAFTRLTGYSEKELIGKNPRILSSSHTPIKIYKEMWQTLNETGHWQGELFDKRKDGSIYPKWLSITTIKNNKGEILNYIGIFTDTTKQKNAEEKIQHLVTHDNLTGLYNRFSLEERLQQSISHASQSNEKIAVLFINMDRFKQINDSAGYKAGNNVLQQIAKRLELITRSDNDIIARIGGDEFIVVLNNLKNPTEAALIATTILHILEQPYSYKQYNNLHSSPSIGISIFPDDAKDFDTLFKNTNLAMNHSKELENNNYHFFTDAMNKEAEESTMLEHDLRSAIQNNQLILYYEPQIKSDSNTVIGLEALIRWKHPSLGYISPEKFIPIAEISGQIIKIGEWVLNQSCKQLVDWNKQKITNIRIAINVSVHQLHSDKFIHAVKTHLNKYHLKPEQLDFEITETVAMSNPENTIKQLQSLRDLGVELSIDDFGTGYSSLAYLKLLPIHTLKLDRAFIKNLEFDENDQVICSASISLAHSLGLSVVGEGIETEKQKDFLISKGCDYLQGYLFSRPLPSKEATAYLLEHQIN